MPNSRLPTLKSVIEYFDHLQSVNSYSIEHNVTLDLMNHWVKYTLREMCPNRVISGTNTGEYGPEITPYLDSFHAVIMHTPRQEKEFNLVLQIIWKN